MSRSFVPLNRPGNERFAFLIAKDSLVARVKMPQRPELGQVTLKQTFEEYRFSVALLFNMIQSYHNRGRFVHQKVQNDQRAREGPVWRGVGLPGFRLETLCGSARVAQDWFFGTS